MKHNFSGHLCYMTQYGNVDEEAGPFTNENEEEDNEDEDHLSKEAIEKKENKKEKKEIVQRFVFFDFETTQENVLGETKYGQAYEHVPNLCVAFVTCDMCRKRDFEAACSHCGNQENVFKGEDCVQDFCKFLFNKKMENTTAIAHNSRGFDSHFILKYFHEQGIAPKVICRGNFSIYNKNFIIIVNNAGTQLMILSINNIRIIDSFNFIPMPLASMPKAFGIEGSSKGFFPHLFNLRENQSYKGPFPDAFCYSPSTMKPNEYDKFMKWYNGQQEKVNLLYIYCLHSIYIILGI